MLLGQVEELVSRTLDSVDFNRHDVLEDALHHVLLCSICAEAHVGLEVTSLGLFSLILDWRNIGRRGGGPVSSTVVYLEKPRLNRTDICAGYTMLQVCEGLVDDSYHGATSDSNSNHVGHMLEVAICEGFLAVNRINPHSNIFSLELLSIGSCYEVDRGRVLIDDLRVVPLVLLCLPPTA